MTARRPSVVVAAGTVGGAGTAVALESALRSLRARDVELHAVVPSVQGRGGRGAVLAREAVGIPRGDVYIGFADRLPLVRRAAPIQVLAVQNPHLYGPAPADWGIALRTKRGFLRWWARRSVGRADLIVCSTAASRRDLLAATRAAPDRIEVRPIPPPDVGRPKAEHRPAVRRVLLVGDVYGYKHLDVAVDAVAAFARRVGRPVELVHLGSVRDASAETSLAAAVVAAAEAGVTVRRPGAVAHDVVLDEMRSADVTVLCSSAETQGLPLAEAMAVGLPAVCRAIEVFVEQGGDGVRFVEVDGGADAFAEALVDLDDAEVRSALAERARASSSGAGSGWDLLPRGWPT